MYVCTQCILDDLRSDRYQLPNAGYSGGARVTGGSVRWL